MFNFKSYLWYVVEIEIFLFLLVFDLFSNSGGASIVLIIIVCKFCTTFLFFIFQSFPLFYSFIHVCMYVRVYIFILFDAVPLSCCCFNIYPELLQNVTKKKRFEKKPYCVIIKNNGVFLFLMSLVNMKFYNQSINGN